MPIAGQRLTRWGTFGPHLCTALGALWVTRSFWWPGRYVIGFDTYTYSGPNLLVTESAWRDLRLPLWNDAIFGGVTHLGNPSAGSLYLPRLVVLPLEDNRALGVLVTAHVVLLGCGMVALVRRLGAGPLAATFAGLVTVLSGTVLTKAVQFEQILVLAWAPWLLTAIACVLWSPRPWRAVAGTAAVTGAILVAGHPQMAFQITALAAAATIGFAWRDEAWRRLPHLIAGVALGAAMAAPQLVAALVATSESTLAGGRDDVVLGDPDLVLLPNTAARAVLGTLSDRDPAAFASTFESVAFVGVPVVILAAVGFVDAIQRRDRRPWALSFGALAVVALVWSFGPRTIAFRAAARLLPGFDLARVSARWLVVVSLVAILLAAAGVDAVLRRPRGQQAVTAASASVLGAMLIAWRDMTGGDGGGAVQWTLLAVATVGLIGVGALGDGQGRAIAGAAVGALAVAPLAIMSLHSFPQRLAEDTPFTAFARPTTAWLRDQDGFTISLTDDLQPAEYGVPGLRPNANVVNAIRSVDGYDGGVQVTERWATALRRLTPDPATNLPLRNNLSVPLDAAQLARLGVRYVLIDNARPADVLVPGWLGPRARDDQFTVWENPDWVGEALAWSSAEAGEPAAAADTLRVDIDTLAATALVDGVPGFACSVAAATCDPVGLRIERDRPEHVEVATDLPRRTIVSVTQQFSSGWRAEIDGEGVEVIQVDGLWLGVDVPAGRHEIDLRYRPAWLLPSLIVAALAATATIVLALMRR